MIKYEEKAKFWHQTLTENLENVENVEIAVN